MTIPSIILERMSLGFTCCIGGGKSFTCAISVPTLAPRSKGTRPVSISYIITPSE